jgi:dynein heavy chain
MDKFHNLLRLLSNEVVHRAISMVGENILREPLEVSTYSVNSHWYKLYVT